VVADDGDSLPAEHHTCPRARLVLSLLAPSFTFPTATSGVDQLTQARAVAAVPLLFVAAVPLLFVAAVPLLLVATVPLLLLADAA